MSSCGCKKNSGDIWFLSFLILTSLWILIQKTSHHLVLRHTASLKLASTKVLNSSICQVGRLKASRVELINTSYFQPFCFCRCVELTNLVIRAVFLLHSSVIKMTMNCSCSPRNSRQKKTKPNEQRRCINVLCSSEGGSQKRLHSASSECYISCLQQLCWKVKYYSILCSALHAKYFSSQVTLVCTLWTMASRTR